MFLAFECLFFLQFYFCLFVHYLFFLSLNILATMLFLFLCISPLNVYFSHSFIFVCLFIISFFLSLNTLATLLVSVSFIFVYRTIECLLVSPFYFCVSHSPCTTQSISLTRVVILCSFVGVATLPPLSPPPFLLPLSEGELRIMKISQVVS